MRRPPPTTNRLRAGGLVMPAPTRSCGRPWAGQRHVVHHRGLRLRGPQLAEHPRLFSGTRKAASRTTPIVLLCTGVPTVARQRPDQRLAEDLALLGQGLFDGRAYGILLRLLAQEKPAARAFAGCVSAGASPSGDALVHAHPNAPLLATSDELEEPGELFTGARHAPQHDHRSRTASTAHGNDRAGARPHLRRPPRRSRTPGSSRVLEAALDRGRAILRHGRRRRDDQRSCLRDIQEARGCGAEEGRAINFMVGTVRRTARYGRTLPGSQFSRVECRPCPLPLPECLHPRGGGTTMGAPMIAHGGATSLPGPFGAWRPSAARGMNASATTAAGISALTTAAESRCRAR